MPRAQSSQPTVKKDLEGRVQLQPTIRTGLSTYDESRPAYVERPYGAGRQWEVLAHSLSGLDKNLSTFLQNRLDHRIEKEIAEGSVMFTNWQQENKNRESWKTFVEQHPQYRGDNPWLQKGFEQARLQSLGLQFDKELTDAAVTSGLQNERDPQVISQWYEQYAKDFRERNNISNYSDRLMLAANYSPLEARAKASFLNAHSAAVKAQNESLLIQQTNALVLEEMDAAFDPRRGGTVPGHPDQKEANDALILEIIDKNTSNALDHGVSSAKEGDIKAEMIFSAYYRYGEDPDLLDLLSRMKTRDGSIVANLPGVAEKLNQINNQRINRQRAAAQFYWSMKSHQEAEQKKFYEGAWFINWHTQKDEQGHLVNSILTEDELQKQGVPKHLWAGLMDSSIKWTKTRREGFLEGTENQGDLVFLEMQAETGDLTQEQILGLAPIIGRDNASSLWKTSLEAQESGDKERFDITKTLRSELYSAFSRDKKDLNDLLEGGLGFGFSADLTREQKLGLDAVKIGEALMTARYEDYLKRNNGKRPSKLTMLEWTTDIKLEVNDKLSKQFSPQKNAATTSPVARQAGTPMKEWITQNIPEYQGRPFKSQQEFLTAVQTEHPEKYEELMAFIQSLK